MNKRICLVLLSISLLLGSFIITTEVLADFEINTIGTPTCREFRSDGTRCYELYCKFSSTNGPSHYEKCETPDGQGWEDPRANYSVQQCELTGIGCINSADLTCKTKPPDDKNQVAYSYEPCDGEIKTILKELRCPIKCKRCDTPPNTLGLCPQGYTKLQGCCMRGLIGETCTSPNPDNSCPYGNSYTTTPEGGTYCCPASGGGEPEECPQPTPIYPCDAFTPSTMCPYEIDYLPCMTSPIVIDVLGNGFKFTDITNGVNFDFDGNTDNIRERYSWTAANSDDAWLFLDRNGNGVVDSGRELFGNFTPQPSPPTGEQKNGFLALAEYDKPTKGGNNDGMIDVNDIIFTRLRLWQDVNHNGISEANELHTLLNLGIAKFELDYKESKRTDEFGNQFKYRAKVWDVHGAQAGRWSWDVFIQRGN